MVMGWQYFLYRSRIMGNILDIVDSPYLIAILGFCFLLYMIIKDVWF